MLAEKFRRDRDVIAPRLARGMHRFGHAERLARTGQPDEHGQIDPGDHFDAARFEQGDRQIGRRAAEQVGQNDNAFAGIGARDRLCDFAAAQLHIVARPDADRGDLVLLAHDVFHRIDEMFGEIAVGDEDHANHANRADFRFWFKLRSETAPMMMTGC